MDAVDDTILMNLDLLLPKKIVAGWGRRREIGALAAGLGNRVILVEGSRTLRNSSPVQEIRRALSEAGLEVVDGEVVTREPTIEDVDCLVDALQSHAGQSGTLVIGLGGGAALDMAKAVAAMLPQSEIGSVRDYLEGLGSGRKLVERPLPILAVPTTSGTGSEATKNAVIGCTNPSVKKSLRSEWLLPECVLLDPELTISLPAAQTAASGGDAITQLVESYVTRRAQPATDALCIQGLQLALPALATCCRDGSHREAREAMAMAAFLSGMALANSGLGMAHGVAAALGAQCDVAHGVACAALLVPALRVNQEVARKRLANLGRVTIESLRSASDEDASAGFIAAIEELFIECGLPQHLRDLGVHRNQLPDVVKGSRGNSMSGNPRELSDAELSQILEACW